MKVTHPDHGLQRWQAERVRSNRRAGPAITLRRAADAMLAFTAALALLRGTQMWFGYPSSQSEFATINPLPMQFMIYGLVALIGVNMLLDWSTVRNGMKGVSTLLIVALLFMVLSVAASVDVAASMRGMVAVFAITVPLLMYSWRFGATRSVQLLRNFAAVTVFANIAYAVVQPQHAFMTGSLAGTMRGLFSHKNLFGQVMSVYVIILLPSPAERPWLRWPVILRSLACIGAVVCIIGARSSTAIVQAGIGMLCLGFAAGVLRIHTKSFRSYTVLLVFLGVLALFFFSGLMIASTVAEGVGKDLTFSGRTTVWGALLPHALDYPFTGYGFSMLRNTVIIEAMTKSVPWGVRSTHNTYIELLLNLGIPGALTWFAFLLSRVYAKLVSAPATAMGQMARNRQVAIMLMILFGSFTEAGQMLAPLAMWTILVITLPKSGEAQRALPGPYAPMSRPLAVAREGGNTGMRSPVR